MATTPHITPLTHWLDTGHACTGCVDSLNALDPTEYVGRHRADMASRMVHRADRRAPTLSHDVWTVAHPDTNVAACGDFIPWAPFRVLHEPRGMAALQCSIGRTARHAKAAS